MDWHCDSPESRWSFSYKQDKLNYLSGEHKNTDKSEQEFIKDAYNKIGIKYIYDIYHNDSTKERIYYYRELESKNNCLYERHGMSLRDTIPIKCDYYYFEYIGFMKNDELIKEIRCKN